jgi:hypothetical protein
MLSLLNGACVGCCELLRGCAWLSLACRVAHRCRTSCADGREQLWQSRISSHTVCLAGRLQIAARELRLVQVQQVAALAAGQPAAFQLLRRPRDSIIPEVVAAVAAGGTQQAQQASPGGPEGASASGNRFAKFTLVGDATPLWVAEAQRLAQHAAQVGAPVHAGCPCPSVSCLSVRCGYAWQWAFIPPPCSPAPPAATACR